MGLQKSQQNQGRAGTSGILYVVAAPIGHYDDLSLRALSILGEVDLIASEDPMAAQALLRHHGITAAVTSYGPLDRRTKAAVLLHELHAGRKIALLSDEGTPLIYDPGTLLVRAALEAGLPVVPVPGPSVVTAALSVSGMNCDRFRFGGMLPRADAALRSLVLGLKREAATSVFVLESSRLWDAVAVLSTLLPRRRIAIACDLTTAREKVLRGLPRLVLSQRDTVGHPQTVTLVIEGASGASRRHGRKSGGFTRRRGAG